MRTPTVFAADWAPTPRERPRERSGGQDPLRSALRAFDPREGLAATRLRRPPGAVDRAPFDDQGLDGLAALTSVAGPGRAGAYGSMRVTVPARSMPRSNDITASTPVASALATR